MNAHTVYVFARDRESQPSGENIKRLGLDAMDVFGSAGAHGNCRMRDGATTARGFAAGYQ